MIRLLDFIFPKICIVCKKQEGIHLCEDCLALVGINTAYVPMPREYALSGLFYAASYEDARIQQAIYALKYTPFLRDLARPLSSIIISHFALADKPFTHNPDSAPSRAPSQAVSYLLCPIPLHKRRLKWRGYNHAEELCRYLSDATGIPYRNLLSRTRDTRPQVELNEHERNQNMHGAFAMREEYDLSNTYIFLVDDVFTTGATMNEAARVLLGADANKVWGITVARGT